MIQFYLGVLQFLMLTAATYSLANFWEVHFPKNEGRKLPGEYEPLLDSDHSESGEGPTETIGLTSPATSPTFNLSGVQHQESVV